MVKDKEGITSTNAFQKILTKSNSKPNKIWVDKGREYYKRSMKLWLEKNDIEMYSTHNEGKSLLLKDLLEPWQITFINIWFYIKKCVYWYITRYS